MRDESGNIAASDVRALDGKPIINIPPATADPKVVQSYRQVPDEGVRARGASTAPSRTHARAPRHACWGTGMRARAQRSTAPLSTAHGGGARVPATVAVLLQCCVCLLLLGCVGVGGRAGGRVGECFPVFVRRLWSWTRIQWGLLSRRHIGQPPPPPDQKEQWREANRRRQRQPLQPPPATARM